MERKTADAGVGAVCLMEFARLGVTAGLLWRLVSIQREAELIDGWRALERTFTVALREEKVRRSD